MKNPEPAEDPRLADLRRDIAEGIAEADRGESVPLDEAAADRIKRRGREHLQGKTGGTAVRR